MAWRSAAGNIQNSWSCVPSYTLCNPRPASGPEGLAVTLTGEANAVGENTFAETKLYSRVFDRGAVQFTFGTAVSYASASSGPESPAYASANNSLQFANADFYLSSNLKVAGGGGEDGASWSREMSTTTFLGLNVVGWNFESVAAEAYGEGQFHTPDSIQGNLAQFHIDAIAYSDDSYVSANDVTLATEGLSSNTTFSTAAIGDGGSTAAPIIRGGRKDYICTKDKDTYVDAGGGNDVVCAGDGDDWIHGGSGKDSICAWRGDNTVFAGRGNDEVWAENGDDWVFGGAGRDILSVGHGNNIVYGGDGNDKIYAGKGNDAICGGSGNDNINAGAGQNSILLGTGSRISDGNDCIKTGNGDDWFFLSGNFGRDTVKGFVVAEGDKLVIDEEFWGFTSSTEAIADGSISLKRASFDKRDLTITLNHDDVCSSLTLDNFFQQNAQYGDPNSRAPLTDAQVATLLHDILVFEGQDANAQQRAEYFTIGDFLSLLG